MIRFKQLKKQWLRWLSKQRKGSFAQSNPLTIITKPLWQHEKIRLLMGGPLVAAVITGASGQMPSSDSLQSWDISQSTANISSLQTNLSTETTLMLPVKQLTGISQFYHPGHRGIDFRAPLGSDVLSMEDGKVEKIEELRFGYGRHVYVKGSTGRTTLYAHLGLIMVQPGESIKAGDKIGEIGMTGWTTGPHLHFEVRVNDNQINPMPYLAKPIAAYAAASKQQAKL